MATKKARLTMTPEARERLVAASINGSTVATAILSEDKKPRADILDSANADNVRTKRCVSRHGDEYSTLVMKFGYCMKNFDNVLNPDHGNPDAADRPSNLVWTSPGQFARMFKNLNFSDAELDYFDSAVKENSKVTIRIGSKFKDFEFAYNGANYSIFCDSDGTLQNSCMRYNNTAEIAADFYKNFCGCRIMIATNARHEVVGRAVIWDGVDCYDNNDGSLLASNVSFLDRKYYSFFFVKKMMIEYAYEHGIDLIKTHDDINSQRQVTPTHDFAGFTKGDVEYVAMRKDVPHIRWHKHGAPYVDTMSNIMVSDDKKLYLSNYEDGIHGDIRVAECRHTDGSARSCSRICPCCGKTFQYTDCCGTSNVWLCSTCYKKLFVPVAFGTALKGKCVKYKGLLLPAEVAKSEHVDKAINLSRLFD